MEREGNKRIEERSKGGEVSEVEGRGVEGNEEKSREGEE